MKKSLIALLALIASSASLEAADPSPSVKITFDKLLGAIQAGDREAFVADATDAVKQGTTQPVMDALSKQLGSRLKKGFAATYLCQLKQRGLHVHLWKVTFKDGGDDVVVRVVLDDEGKLEGFFLQ